MPHPLFAFGLPHGSEWLYILLAIVILFGADKIPKLARGLGRSLGEFKKAKDDFEKEIHNAANEPDAKAGDKTPHISGNLPGPVTPGPFNSAGPFDKATSGDELTKKS